MKLNDFLILREDGEPLPIEHWEQYFTAHPELVDYYYDWIVGEDQ